MNKLSDKKLELLKSNKEKEIDFTITLHGRGTTISEAWDDAVESFTMDPGQGYEEDVTEVEEAEGWDDEDTDEPT